MSLKEDFSDHLQSSKHPGNNKTYSRIMTRAFALLMCAALGRTYCSGEMRIYLQNPSFGGVVEAVDVPADATVADLSLKYAQRTGRPGRTATRHAWTDDGRWPRAWRTGRPPASHRTGPRSGCFPNRTDTITRRSSWTRSITLTTRPGIVIVSA